MRYYFFIFGVLALVSCSDLASMEMPQQSEDLQEALGDLQEASLEFRQAHDALILAQADLQEAKTDLGLAIDDLNQAGADLLLAGKELKELLLDYELIEETP